MAHHGRIAAFAEVVEEAPLAAGENRRSCLLVAVVVVATAVRPASL